MYSALDSVKSIVCEDYSALSESILRATEPVILKGLVKAWPLVQHSQSSIVDSANYLRRFYNDKPVFAMVADAKEKGRFFYNEDLTGFNFARQQMNFRDLLDALIADEPSQRKGFYVGSTSVDQILPGLRDAQNDIPQLSDKPLVSIWVGNQSRIAAHYDVTDNVACVAAGKRRFTLFGPEQLDNLYIGPLDFTPAGQPASLVDFHQPDFIRFPKFKTALEHALVAELEAGDGIFIPSMWWHHVEALSDFNILVNYWWRQVPNYVGVPSDALNHAMLAIKSLPLEQREAWRHLFDHYVFRPAEQEHIPAHARGMLDAIDENSARKLRAVLLNKLNR
ncbi:cupin-like domain-containing protein [Flavobacterium sp. W21_SRS_FM6]|uniref:cupin-like domain-containing protein n=1 Tax=Flavobacterium sp. W21_SRS_FM6 TaxID=3240268 RepID=UPI003F90A272